MTTPLLIDTHCHLHMIVQEEYKKTFTLEEFSSIESVIAQAHKAHVQKMITIGTSLIDSALSLQIAQSYESVYATIGIHPSDATAQWQQDVAILKKYCQSNCHKLVAIGEIGLDYHYPDYNKQRQQDAFKACIELALEYNLPIVIHTRDAFDDTMNILTTYKKDFTTGVVHCFSEGLQEAQDVLDLGFRLGIVGSVTYPKNDRLREVVKTIGLDNIVLETDSPFLAPQSIRGKKNSPAQILTIAQYIAQLLETDVTTVAKKTTLNAQQVFPKLV